MSYYFRRSVLTLIWLSVAMLLLMSLISYSVNDPSWSHRSSLVSPVSNLAGMGGAWLADILYTFLGAASWWLVVLACYEGWRVWYERTVPQGALRTLGYIFLIIATAALTGLMTMSWLAQGILGQLVGQGLGDMLTLWGARVFVCLFIILTLTFTFNVPWLQLLSRDIGRDEQAATDPLPTNQLIANHNDHPDQTQKNQNEKNQNEKNQKSDAIYESTEQQLPLSLTGEIDASHASRNILGKSVMASQDNQQTAPAIARINPLDAFLDESGLSNAKNYQAPDEVANPFKPVSAEHIANLKLTKKLDAQLKNETIADSAQNPKQSPVAMPVTPVMSSHLPNQAAVVEVVAPTTTDPASVDLPLDVAPSSNTVPNDADWVEGIIEQPVKNSDNQNAVYTEVIADVDNRVGLNQPIEPQTDALTPVWTSDDAAFVNRHHDLQSEQSDDGATDDPFQAIAKATLQQNQDIVDLSPEALVTPTAAVTTAVVTEPVDLPEPVVTELVSTEDDDSKSTKIVMPTHHRSVEVDELQPIDPLPDIHNDAFFAAKSRAMQTATYRASLSPLPDLSLLELPDPERKPSYSREQLQQLSELLEIKLQEFNVKAQVVNAQLGPVVTRFEVALAPGIKASKVTGIARDLARSLSMASVRVVEVIPGKPYIGIEVPNPQRQMVRLIELLQTDAYRDPNGMISMAMGKDIAGKPIIADLAKAPHMLVAGTTGSGKSVLVNSLLLSMLLKYTPEQLRLILIDPKQLELANYNDIPHLLTPVVTDMTEAASALSWCVAEMERRYQLMSLFKVRKLDEFNKKIIAANEQGHPLLDPLWRIHDSASQDKPPQLKPLPQVVIVADEFADMIMQVGKQAEELITRLAQKSRAAGIHLILATQRPSVDVITGLIKANIPVRAALRVNSKVDSRTILDAGGAEDMLGHGDMLFLAPGKIEPMRVHGAFISDAEVNAICDAWRERGAPDYIDNIFDNFELSAPTGSGGDNGTIATGDEDALYDEVVAFVLETRKVSASSIQRKFSIGYNRAARIVDAMEEAGLVSGMGKSGKRELLV